MTISDGIMILAVFLGPIVAVRLTRYLDDKKEVRERKLWIFKTLMATRAYMVSPNHVEALNRIDLEFTANNNADKRVLEQWRLYLDLLGDKNIPKEQWLVKQVDLLVDLLYVMGQALGYDFDKTQIKNGTYSPNAHGRIEHEQETIRRGIMELIEGKRVLPMHVTNIPTPSHEKEEAEA